MSVSITAKALLYDRQADAGLVGSLFRRDKSKGAVFIDRLTIPIVDYASQHVGRIYALDRLEDGDYLVQLTLPNGDTMTEDFKVSQGQDTELVFTLPHEGPHEWTSLQALTGQFTKGALAEPSYASRGDVGDTSYAMLRQDPEYGFQLRFVDMDRLAARRSLLKGEALPQLASLISEGLNVPDAAARLGMGESVESASEEDEDFALFKFVRRGCIGDGAERDEFTFGPGSGMTRSYLLELSSQGATLISLPAPWTRMEYETEIQLLLDKRSLRGEPEYTLTIGDPMINAALGYIRNGAMHEAARLIDFSTAEHLLFNKISSPLPATIGGYLLVLGLDRQAYRSRSEAWKRWLDNLCGWFDWLPDGAILKSAKYFVLGDKDRTGALEALMSAYDRGLPFFTFGLNLMLEGMRRFANEGETLAQDRLPILEGIAAATDPSHNFLAVKVARRWDRSESLPLEISSQADPRPAQELNSGTSQSGTSSHLMTDANVPVQPRGLARNP